MAPVNSENVNGHITSRMWEIQFAIKVMMLTNLAAGMSRMLFIFGRLFARVSPCLCWRKCFSLGQAIFDNDAYIHLYSWAECPARFPVSPLSPFLPLSFDDGKWILRSFKLITYNFRVPKISKVLMDDLVGNTLTQPGNRWRRRGVFDQLPILPFRKSIVHASVYALDAIQFWTNRSFFLLWFYYSSVVCHRIVSFEECGRMSDHSLFV